MTEELRPEKLLKNQMLLKHLPRKLYCNSKTIGNYKKNEEFYKISKPGFLKNPGKSPKNTHPQKKHSKITKKSQTQKKKRKKITKKKQKNRKKVAKKSQKNHKKSQIACRTVILTPPPTPLPSNPSPSSPPH